MCRRHAVASSAPTAFVGMTLAPLFYGLGFVIGHQIKEVE